MEALNDFLKSVRFKILVGLATVLVGFMIMAIYSGGTAPLISQIFGAVVEPVQKLSSDLSGNLSEQFNQYLNAARTYEENEELRAEVAELRRQLVDYERVKHEYEQYRKLSEVQDPDANTTYEPASVIERDHHSNYFYSFTIDKGSLDGVKFHDPVISSEGTLVGHVVEVRLTSAKVMTILDVNFNAGAYNSKTRDVGSVTGTVDLAAEGLCRMEYLPRESEIEAGDIIVTSGGTLFPKNIVIGQVESVHTSSRGNSLEATIRPAAEISSVKDVFVITGFEGQGEE